MPDTTVEYRNEVTVIEEAVNQTDLHIAGDQTEVSVAGEETIIEAIESVSHVIHEADVVRLGNGFSFWPQGW